MLINFLRPAFKLALLAGALGAGVALWCYSRGPWLGRYYANETWQGESPKTWRERRLQFDWQGQPPFKGLPAEHFSARYLTCLPLPTPKRVRFTLSSDDGARFFIDDELTLDNASARWKNSKIVDLAPGMHTLRVDYAQAQGRALLFLEARTDTRWEDLLSPRLLQFPQGDRCDG